MDLWEFCVYLHRSLIEHKSDIAVIHEDEWKLEMSLELFDANKDGFVTADELARIMQDRHGADPNPCPNPCPNPKPSPNPYPYGFTLIIMQLGHGGLDDDEFANMVEVLGLQDGGRMTMEAMRQHECWEHLGGLFGTENAMAA